MTDKSSAPQAPAAPVAWMYHDKLTPRQNKENPTVLNKRRLDYATHPEMIEIPLYAAPPAPTLEGIAELRKLIVEWRKGPIVSSDSCAHCCADDLERVLQHITPMQEEKP